jgi:hypothetical protein
MTGDDPDGPTDQEPKEFEGDLAGAVFWGADLRGAHFRDVDLTGTRISHALVVDVEIDAMIDAVVINGVDVTAYVNEHDPWFPLRSMLRPTTPAEARAGWSALEAEWDRTIEQASALPQDAVHASVDGEWSFVQTLRHVVFAIDKWFTAPILGEPFDPMGLPNSGSVDFPWPDVDQQLTPSFAEARRVHADRTTRVRDFLAGVGQADFARPIEVLENGSTTLQEGLFTAFEEAFWHNRYARRDLERLADG